MIANPKEIAVEVVGGADVEDKFCVIQTGETSCLEPEGFRVHNFVLSVDGVEVAVSPSAQALSRWALDQNAKAVRFDFDLRVSR